MNEKRIADLLLVVTIGLSAVLVAVNYFTQPPSIRAMTYHLATSPQTASADVIEEVVGMADQYEEELSEALASWGVNVNSADAEELMSLPGIGEILAGRIIEERAQASFERVEDLERVKGIGPKTIEKLAPYVCVE